MTLGNSDPSPTPSPASNEARPPLRAPAEAEETPGAATPSAPTPEVQQDRALSDASLSPPRVRPTSSRAYRRRRPQRPALVLAGKVQTLKTADSVGASPRLAPLAAPQPEAPASPTPASKTPATSPAQAQPAPQSAKPRGFPARTKPRRPAQARKRPKLTLEVRAKLAARKPPSPRQRPRQGLLETLHRSPAYGAAAFLHLVILVGLSFWTVAVHFEQEASVDVQITPSKNVLPTDNLSERLDAKAAAEKSLSKALVGAKSDSPFAEAEGEIAGALRGQASKVLGLAGGKGGGLGRGGSGGDSSGSKRSIHLGLDWLVRHRTRDGCWRGLDEDHSSPDTIPTRGGHVGQTGLGLLAFLCAGHGPDKEGPYRAVIQGARDWLLTKVGSGDFSRPRFNHLSTYYERAIGTLALAEWLQRSPTDVKVREALVRCVKHLTASRDPARGGWRYRAARGSDTSVTSWVMLALKSARHAKVEVPEENFEGARLWVESVTNSKTGTTGYVGVGDGRENGAMAATGLFLRILLGGSEAERVNRLAIKHVSRIRVSARRGKVGNLYEVYYGALAMYQVGGREWRRFNPKIRDAMVAAQLKRGCELGGWRGSSWVAEPVAATCLAILTLETYYRYIPQRGAAASSAGESALDAAHGLRSDLEAASAAGKLSEADLRPKLLATQAAYAKAVKLLEVGPQGDWDLLIDAYVGQARLLAREGELEPALATLRRAAALVPRGEPAPPSIAQLQRRLALLQAIQEAEVVIAKAQELGGRKDTSDEQRAQAMEEIRRATRILKARGLAASLDASGRETLRALSSALDAAATLLIKSADRDAMIEAELARLRERGPTPQTLGGFERRVILLLIQRGHERYTLARVEANTARFLQAESDRTILLGLNPLGRGSAADRARLGPALEQLELARVAGRIALKDPQNALAAVGDYHLRFPQGTYRRDAERLERALLISLGPPSSLADTKRARLTKLLLEAGARQDPLSALEHLVLGDLLLERGEARRAAQAFGDAHVGASSESLRRAAKLGRSRALRALGQGTSALAELNGLPSADNERLDVIQERCAVLRALGKFSAAIREYVLVLNAIEDQEPQTWWDVAEALARTYVEAKQPRAARTWLEGLRSKDRSFGEDPERRKRLIKLMLEVDLLAARGGE